MPLHDRLAQQLMTIQAELASQGKLYPKTQLDAFYATFRSRFGPDRLAGLDGEELLETMHSHGTRDSLVYWLEFKNDEELPAFFGSIAGGTALKFGIYKRRETGAWTVGSPKQQRDITVEEAVAIARKHRDQLVKGCELLERLAPSANDADYAALQRELNNAAPDVSDSAWGHKYFHMMAPAKLDDFHSPNYQRYNLIKLLQLPPGPGRYEVAGRFVALARELDMPITHLTTCSNFRNKEPHRYWRVGTTSGETRQSYWPAMRDGNCVAVGWRELGDLSWVTYDRESKNKLRALLAEKYPNTPQAVGRATQQVFDFVVGFGDRDLILAAAGARTLGVGRIAGSYFFEGDQDFPHRRPVEWLDLGEWQLPNPEGLRTTVYEYQKDANNLIAIERRLLEAEPVARSLPTIPPHPQAIRTPRLDGFPGRIQAILERKGQVILYGPPGTGKTYWALHTALELAAYSAYGRPYSELADDEQRAVVGNESNTDSMVQVVTFHPAYGYEDFIEGYRPRTEGQHMVFVPRDGTFRHLCKLASAQPSRRFFLLVDEINRGDIPRIFGELLTLLEKDKRGTPVTLPLSGKPFSVPENVYVIGTMNTADRSIALLDTALRRRFGFIELMPDASALGAAVVGGIPLGPWLAALNDRIREYIGRDARNLQIGHAYLMDRGRPITDFRRFAQAIQDDILPLLQEYCYEDYAALVKILGTGLVDEGSQRIRHELFETLPADELAAALLEPCPDLATLPRAVEAQADAEPADEAVIADEDEASD